MIKYSAFFPAYTAVGVEGTSLAATRNVNLGEWNAIANGTQLNIGDTLQYFGSTFTVVAPLIKGVATGAPDVNPNFQIYAAKGGDGNTLYTWIAYSDSADGASNFTTGVPGSRTYIGIAANKSSGTESTNNTDYVWSKMQGPQGPSIVITPSQAGFIYLDGALTPSSQNIIFTAAFNGISGPAIWSTTPDIGKNGTVSNSLTISNIEMGANTQLVVTATVGTLSQSQLLQKIADPTADQTSINVAFGIPGQAVTATNPDFAGITGPTRPSDFAGTSVVFIPLNARTSVTGNSVALNTSGQGWNSGAMSREFFVGAAAIAGRPITTSSGEAMMGLIDNTLGTGPNNFTQLNYAFYIVSGQMHIYENGSYIQPQGAYDTNTQLQIVYDGVTVKYYINSALVRTVGTLNGRTFKAAVALGAEAPYGFRDITFGAFTMNNWTAIAGPGRPTDNADVTSVNTSADTARVNGVLAADLTLQSSQAKTTADIAKQFADDVADNTKFSSDEKKRYVAQVNEWITSVPALVAKLNSFGLTSQANNLTAAWSDGSGLSGGFLRVLENYGYSQVNITTTGIDRSLFQSKARAFSDNLIASANAMDQKASETANVNGGIYDNFNGFENLTRGQIRTALGNSLGIANQADWATYTGYNTGTVAGRIQYLQNDGYIQDTTIYKPGVSFLSERWPAEAGSNVTENRNSAGFANQGNLATRNMNVISVDGVDHLDSFNIRRAFNGSLLGNFWPQEANANITENRTAAAFTNQGPFATDTRSPESVFNPRSNIVKNGGFTLEFLNWTPGINWGWTKGSTGEGPYVFNGGGGTSILASDKISVYPSAIYTLQAELSTFALTSGSVNCDVEFYSGITSLGTSPLRIGKSSGFYTRDLMTFTTPSNCNALRVRIFNENANVGSTVSARRVKISQSHIDYPFTDESTDGASAAGLIGRIINPQVYNTQAVMGADNVTNLAPTQSNNGSSYTVNLPAHNRYITGVNGPVTLYYGAGSFNVPYSTYWISYIDDPDQTGFASPTFNYTTEPTTLLYPGRYLVSSGVTPDSTGTGGTAPGTGGGNDPPEDNTCVEFESYMPDNRQAFEYNRNDDILILNETFDGSTHTTVQCNRITTSACVEIVSVSGIELVASVTTPITLFGGQCLNITEALGQFLPVEDDNGFRWEQIVEVNFVGDRKVAHISCHGQTYAAGKKPNKFIYTHNLRKI